MSLPFFFQTKKLSAQQGRSHFLSSITTCSYIVNLEPCMHVKHACFMIQTPISLTSKVIQWPMTQLLWTWSASLQKKDHLSGSPWRGKEGGRSPSFKVSTERKNKTHGLWAAWATATQSTVFTNHTPPQSHNRALTRWHGVGGELMESERDTDRPQM